MSLQSLARQHSHVCYRRNRPCLTHIEPRGSNFPASYLDLGPLLLPVHVPPPKNDNLSNTGVVPYLGQPLHNASAHRSVEDLILVEPHILYASATVWRLRRFRGCAQGGVVLWRRFHLARDRSLYRSLYLRASFLHGYNHGIGHAGFLERDQPGWREIKVLGGSLTNRRGDYLLGEARSDKLNNVFVRHPLRRTL